MEINSDKNKCPFGPKMQRYWDRRYNLFSKFDEGIQIDEVGLYSVTPEKIALEQARKMNCKIIVDGFCGVGGNAIAFAQVCDKVYAIEKDPVRLEMARRNASIYGVADKIIFIHGDFLLEAPKIKAEGVFVDLEWGGRNTRNWKVLNYIIFLPTEMMFWNWLLKISRKSR